MSDETKIIQKAALGSDTTQIGEQNNYYGMTAEEASNLAIKLFMDNFPRLQEEAKKIAKERAEELCKDIVDKLEKQGKTNFSEFSDPDIQYILNKSHQEYARFGTQTLRDLLSNLIVNRINYDNDYYMKILLDEAVEIVKSLSEVHLNYLSLIFLCKEIRMNSINSTPVYNFINDRLVDESAVLRPLSWHLILYVFRYFSRKWQKISDCECPDLIQNETPVRFLYGTQKNVRSDRAESSWHSN